MAAGRDRTRLLKGFLLVIGILILGGIVVMFYIHRQQVAPYRSDTAAEKKDATITMEGIHHTEIRNGVKDGELEAESGDYNLDEKKAYLSMLQATYIDENGENVFLSAESGTWDEDSNDLEVSGNVVLKNNQCVIQTERMIFNDNEQIFDTDSPVVVCCSSLCQESDEGMTYSLDTGITIMKGNVEGQVVNGKGL